MSNLRQRRSVEEPREQRETRLAADRESKKTRCFDVLQKQRVHNRLTFKYRPSDYYSLSQDVQIGTMSKICPYCKALKFNGETMGMYCASGKVKLPQLAAPAEPLNTLLTKIVISADKTPTVEHVRKDNAPTIIEVAIVMVGDQFSPRDIILYR